ncbi:DUF6263 family protein [Gemmatimonadota bacterium]
MNRCRLFTGLLATMSAVIVFGCDSASKTTDLKLGLKEGKTYRTRMVVDQDVKQTMMGQSMDMKQKMTQDLAFEVRDVDEKGNLTVRVTFERIAADIEAGPRKMTYDSAQPADDTNPLAKSYGVMAGQGYTLVVSDRGQLVAISGMDSLINRMIDKMEIDDESMKERMKAQFESAYGEQSARDMCGQMFGMIPPGPVEVGDQWSCSSSGKMMFPITWDQTWVLKEIRGDVMVLDGQSATSIHSGDEPTEMGPVKMLMDMDGTQSGTLELDRDTGLVIGGTMHSSMKGEQRFVDGPPQIKGQTVPVEMEQTITWQPL